MSECLNYNYVPRLMIIVELVAIKRKVARK